MRDVMHDDAERAAVVRQRALPLGVGEGRRRRRRERRAPCFETIGQRVGRRRLVSARSVVLVCSEVCVMNRDFTKADATALRRIRSFFAGRKMARSGHRQLPTANSQLPSVPGFRFRVTSAERQIRCCLAWTRSVEPKKPFDLRGALFEFGLLVIRVVQFLRTRGSIGPPAVSYQISMRVRLQPTYEEADDGSSPRDKLAKKRIVLRELKRMSVADAPDPSGGHANSRSGSRHRRKR